jgi:Ca2+-dependent lipid-binding protein
MDCAVGVLTIKPRTATLTKKSDVLGVGDPYFLIKIGKDEFRTATHKNTQSITFTESFSVQVNNTLTFQVIAMDEDVGKDDFIGMTQVSLENVMHKGKATEKMALSADGKEVGSITIDLEFIRSLTGY